MIGPSDYSVRLAEEFRTLSGAILSAAAQGLPRARFLEETIDLLLARSGADRAGFVLQEKTAVRIACADRGEPPRVTIRTTSRRADLETPDPDAWRERVDPKGHGTTRLGSVWLQTAGLERLREIPGDQGPPYLRELGSWGDARSVAWIPIAVGAGDRGVLRLESRRDGHFDRARIRVLEAAVQILAAALASQHAQWVAGERVKELACLYTIAKIAERRETPLRETLLGVAAAIPPAWQHPALASARIVVDEATHESPDFRGGHHRLSADVVVRGAIRGRVEVFYAEDPAVLEDPPFLPEERKVLDEVAREVAAILERSEAERASERLETQLRHADRLATIGQLAAGVAHELNEPLAGILGFAQLSSKAAGLPEQVAKDLDRIVRATLHAREVVRKLMLFGRPAEPREAAVNLNRVVDESLRLLEGRLADSGVRVDRTLDAALPEIAADPSQMHQILVNLVVNALQAMTGGGTLRVLTSTTPGGVELRVEDSGIGMTEEVLRQIFDPFFTTKEDGTGTGLGLPVVHGIVRGHGGTIEVESEPGRGSRFVVRLPTRPPRATNGGSR